MKKTNIFIVLIGLVGFLICASVYIASAIKSFEADGFGFSIAYGNKDYFMWAILFLVLFFIGLVRIVNSLKRVENRYFDGAMVGLIGLIGTCFYLSVFINKLIEKASFYHSLSLFVIFGLIIGLGISMLADKKTK